MKWWLKEEDKEFYWKKAAKILKDHQAAGYEIDRERIAICGENTVKVFLKPFKVKKGSSLEELEAVPGICVSEETYKRKMKHEEFMGEAYIALKKKRERHER